MKIVITKKALSEGLSIVERVIPSRNSNPLLTFLKIEAFDTSLTFCGTDLEIDLSCQIAAEVYDPQNLIVPAHLLFQIVRKLSSELVTLELKDNDLEISAGKSNFKLQIGDISIYPPIVFPNSSDTVLDGNEFSKALASVRYAASKEAFQPVFRGIKLEHHKDKTRVVASDGYRVAIRDFKSSGEGQDLIIPAKSAEELIRLLKDEEARLYYAEGLLSIITDHLKINIKLLDGEFPNYERVIPKEIKSVIKLDASILKEAISRVSVFTNKDTNHRVEFMISENTLKLASSGPDGSAQDTLEVQQSGEEQAMSLSFNARYVLDALGPLNSEVEMLFSGPSSPAIIREHEDGNYQAVVVALKV